MDGWLSGSAAAINVSAPSSSIPQPGDTVTITDSVNTSLAGTTWIAGDGTFTRSANDLLKWSVSIHRYAKI